MNKKLILLVAVIALALLIPSAVFAGGPGGLSYTSGVQVVNLDSGTATVGLTYFDQSGNIVTTFNDTIAGNSSVTYFPIHAPVGFNGSLVVSSDKPITAIANTVSTDFKYGAATNSFSAGSTSISLPLIMCNNSGFNTWFNVQNTGSSTANITINYTAGSNGVNGSESTTIEPGASKTFDQAAGSGTKNCSTLGNPKFIGSATVTSDQPVVASVMELNTTTSPTLLGYNSFSGGSTTVVAPLIMANNSGFFTSLNIQNAGGSTTTVTVDYTPNQVANGFEPANSTCSNLAPGASCNVLQTGGQWTQQYIGAATVTASEDLVVIVNSVRLSGGATGPFGASYEGFDPATATSDATAALIMSNNSGYFTSVQVMNVGGGACPSVTIDYSPNLAGAFQPQDEVFSLAAGANKSILQTGSVPGNGSTVNNWGTNKYIGSAEVSAPGCQIVTVMVELGLKKGDNEFIYNGLNH